MAKTKKRKIGAGDVASNRYASYRYELLERLECGVALQGTEVKALRESGAQLKDGYASLRDGELWLHSIHIPPYAPASRENRRSRAPAPPARAPACTPPRRSQGSRRGSTTDHARRAAGSVRLTYLTARSRPHDRAAPVKARTGRRTA